MDDELRLLIKEKTDRVKESWKTNPPEREKPWGELSGHEWTERCVEQDYHRNRPWLGKGDIKW